MTDWALFSPAELTAEAVTAAVERNGLPIDRSFDSSIPHQLLGNASDAKYLLASVLDAFAESGTQASLQVSASPQPGSNIDLKFDVQAKNSQALFFASPMLSDLVVLATNLGAQLHFDALRSALELTVAAALPAVASSSLLASAALNTVPPATGPDRGSANRASILMAEDNQINQRVGKLILQRAGFELDLVADGLEAVEAQQLNGYSLILMDCQMPVMDGFEATRRIRALEGSQPVIIAVTANALVGERERCLAAGMDDYLSKPFRAEKLVEVVQHWMNRFAKHAVR